MKNFLLVFLVGCAVDPPPPPPVVTAISPDSGTYGSTITITGTGFGAGSGSDFVAGLAFAQPPETAGFGAVITSWSDTQIVARVPFPTTAGPIHIKAQHGETDTPVFTPETPWLPSEGAVLQNVLEAQPTATGAAVLGFDNGAVKLVVFDGGHATTTMLTGVTASTDDRTPIRARLTLEASGAPVVFATNVDGNIIELVAGAPVATGLAGTVMAAGHDATGPYVWFRVGANLSRARPGAMFSVDRGPITEPGVTPGTDGALDLQIADDGTLIAAIGIDADILFDNEQYLGIARLAPTASAFVQGEKVTMQSYDDYIAAAHLRIAPEGTRMSATFSTQQYDETMDHVQNALARDAAGVWGFPSGELDGHAAIAYLPSAIAALDSLDKDIELIPDIAAATTLPLPLWPAEAAGLLLDGTTLHPLIRVGNSIFYPTMQ